jgi:hypothetical protein
MVKTKSKKNQKNAQVTTEKPSLTLKETLAEKRRIKGERNKLATIISVCLLFALAVGIPTSQLIDIKVGLAIGVGIPSFMVAFTYPRLSLWFFLFYMPFSGTVTYWLGEGNTLFQLAKDVFYIPALIALMLQCIKKQKPILVQKKLIPTFFLLLAVSLIVLLLVNGLNEFLPYCQDIPESERFILRDYGDAIRVSCKDGQPFLQGLLGLKVFIGYIPLIFCGYYLIEDRKQLMFLGRSFVVIAIICCVLGLIQYWLLDTGRCEGTRDKVGDALFRASLEAKCLVGGSLLFSPSQGVIRLPGTFVSPWHWAWFLVANAALTFTTAFSDTSKFWRFCGLIGMALVMINAIISGQRLALGLVPIVIVILLVLTGKITDLKEFLPIAIALGLIVGIVVINNPDIVQNRIDSFVGRWNAAPPTAFIEEQFEWSLRNTKSILGFGLGRATNSARVFGNTALIETFHPKLIYEVGLVGLGAFMIFVTHLVIVSLQDYLSLKDKTLRSFASCFWVFILIITYFPYWYPLDTDPVAIYYWLLAGIIFKLPIIEKAEQKQLKSQSKESNKPSRKTTSRKFKKRSIAT